MATLSHLEQGQDASWRQLISDGALATPQPDHQLHKCLAKTRLYSRSAVVSPYLKSAAALQLCNHSQGQSKADTCTRDLQVSACPRALGWVN